jgi:hypothetical protein
MRNGNTEYTWVIKDLKTLAQEISSQKCKKCQGKVSPEWSTVRITGHR